MLFLFLYIFHTSRIKLFIDIIYIILNLIKFCHISYKFTIDRIAKIIDCTQISDDNFSDEFIICKRFHGGSYKFRVGDKLISTHCEYRVVIMKKI